MPGTSQPLHLTLPSRENTPKQNPAHRLRTRLYAHPQLLKFSESIPSSPRPQQPEAGPGGIGCSPFPHPTGKLQVPSGRASLATSGVPGERWLRPGPESARLAWEPQQAASPVEFLTPHLGFCQKVRFHEASLTHGRAGAGGVFIGRKFSSLNPPPIKEKTKQDVSVCDTSRHPSI